MAPDGCVFSLQPRGMHNHKILKTHKPSFRGFLFGSYVFCGGCVCGGMIAPMTLRLALAQISTKLGDVSANLDKHLEYIRQARRAGAGLVIFR
jgi:hypothetical protein